MDEKQARILARWLDEPEYYPDEPEYPGEPAVHPHRQWQLLQRYGDESWDRTLAHREHRTEEEVSPVEALALAKLLGDAISTGIWGWVYDARREGVSWETVGAALGMTRQGAWDMYAAAMVDVTDKCIATQPEAVQRWRAALGPRPEQDTAA